MDDQDRYTRITLRIPRDLHAKLQAAADESSRSMNAEIIDRVASSFNPDNGVLTAYAEALSAYKRIDEINSQLLAEAGRMMLALAERVPPSGDALVDEMTDAYARLGAAFASDDRSQARQPLDDIARIQAEFRARESISTQEFDILRSSITKK